MKSLLNSQIEISAQVWVCDACGVTDHKSCSCRATAHSEELKKKKEQDRQRAKAYRNRAASRDADIENTKESGREYPQRKGRSFTVRVLRLSQANLSSGLSVAASLALISFATFFSRYPHAEGR
jgi:ribosomal protein S8E